MKSVSTVLQGLLDSVMDPESKRSQTNSDLQQSLIHTHDWIKRKVDLQMVDVTKGPQIFPHTPSRSDFSYTVSAAIDKAMDLRAAEDIKALLNQ